MSEPVIFIHDCHYEIGETDNLDGWMSWRFMSLSTVFQSYQDDGRVNMKGSMQ